MKNSVLLIQQSHQREFLIEQEMLGMSILQFMNHVYSVHGYTPRLYLYQQPFSAFSKLSFLSLANSLNDVISQYPSICFTYDNTQFIQETSSSGFKSKNGEPFVFLILQAKYDNCFHHQTYKISLDCKILFIKSLSSTYGRFSYLVYFDVIVPLDYFQADQTVDNIFKKYQYIDNNIVVIVQNQQAPKLYKSVKNQNMLDKEKFIALCLQNQESIVMGKQANCRTTLQLLSFLIKRQLRFAQGYQLHENTVFKQLESSQVQINFSSQPQEMLQNPLKNSIYIGTTPQYLCFIQQSHILHVYSNQSPFQLINSAILNCLPSLHLQQQIPVLHNDELIMYNITITMITLKYYGIPEGNFKFSRHFNWYSKLYGGIKCSCLDVIALTLKNKCKIRVFYIYSPNDFIQTETISQNWSIYASKHGKNNFSDGSGLLAINLFYSDQIEIYNLKKRQMIHRFQRLQISKICFRHDRSFVLVVGANDWIQYDFSTGIIQREGKNQRIGELGYSPCNQIILFTDKCVRFLETGSMFRISKALLKEGNVFFSKNVQNTFCSYNSIFELEDNKLQKHKSKNHMKQNEAF